MTTLQCGLLARRHSSESSALEVHTLVGYTSAKYRDREIISPQGCSSRQTTWEVGITTWEVGIAQGARTFGAAAGGICTEEKRVVPRSAEPCFQNWRERRFAPGTELQSAVAPRTPQALGQHSCTLSVGADRARTTAARLRRGRARRPPARRPESRRRAAENRTAHDARRRGTADAIE